MGSPYDYQEGLLGSTPGVIFAVVLVIVIVKYIVDRVRHK